MLRCYGATVSSCKKHAFTFVNRQICTLSSEKIQIHSVHIKRIKSEELQSSKSVLKSSTVNMLKHLKFKIYADLCSSYMWGPAKKWSPFYNRNDLMIGYLIYYLCFLLIIRYAVKYFSIDINQIIMLCETFESYNEGIWPSHILHYNDGITRTMTDLQINFLKTERCFLCFIDKNIQRITSYQHSACMMSVMRVAKVKRDIWKNNLY